MGKKVKNSVFMPPISRGYDFLNKRFASGNFNSYFSRYRPAGGDEDQLLPAWEEAATAITVLSHSSERFLYRNELVAHLLKNFQDDFVFHFFKDEK